MNQRAKEILIKTKRRLFSQNLGNNSTAFVGNGIDFSELREYYYGDDVRKINHKATARGQKPYINLFTEEREQNITLVFMVDGSIYFGSKRVKQDLMSEILALLSFSALKNQDPTTTLFFSNTQEAFFKASKSLSLLNQTIPKALEINPLKKSIDMKALVDELLHRIKQKSIIFLIGDFYHESDLSLLSKKHEVYSIIVRDPFEEEPKLFGEIDLVDPESFESVSVVSDNTLLEKYKTTIKELDKKLISHFEENRIKYTKIYTDEDPFIKLRELLK